MKQFVVALAFFAAAVSAQSDVVAPNPNLLIEGIPAIPQSLATLSAATAIFAGTGLRIGIRCGERCL